MALPGPPSDSRWPQTTGHKALSLCTRNGEEPFFNTTFWVDPTEELLGIFMTQIFPSGSDVQERFRIMAYEAIVERE